MLVPTTRGLASTGKKMFCKPSCSLQINTNCCWSANMEGKAKESENRRLPVPSIFTVMSITLHLLTISVIAFGAYYVSTKSEIIDIRLAEVTDENRQLKGQMKTRVRYGAFGGRFSDTPVLLLDTPVMVHCMYIKPFRMACITLFSM